MTLGMTALHLRIADFKFTHNFIICDRLSDTGIVLALMCKRNSHYHMLGIERRITTYRRTADFSYTPKRINKGKDPNINIVNVIHNIKGKTPVNILVSNYSNKHVTFNKGEYVGHLEPTIDNIVEAKNLYLHENPDVHTTRSVTTKK